MDTVVGIMAWPYDASNIRRTSMIKHSSQKDQAGPFGSCQSPACTHEALRGLIYLSCRVAWLGGKRFQHVCFCQACCRHVKSTHYHYFYEKSIMYFRYGYTYEVRSPDIPIPIRSMYIHTSPALELLRMTSKTLTTLSPSDISLLYPKKTE